MSFDKIVELPDGRVVEYVDAVWAEHREDDPPGHLPADVTVSVDGVLETVRVQLSDAQMLKAFQEQSE